MNNELVKKFQEKICVTCNDKDKCRKKPHKMLKCGVLYLVVVERKGM